MVDQTAARQAPRFSSWESFAESRALLALQSAALLALVLTVATRLWQDHVWFGWMLVAATALLSLPELSRGRVRLGWIAYVGGIFVYTLLRSYADDTAIPVQTHYVIEFDQFLFLGRDPIVWLQERLFSPGRTTFVDLLAVAVHWSFFIAPHLGAALVFLFRRELFPRYCALVVGTMYAGLVLFFLLPTTPPWLASQAGDLPGAFRVMDFVGGRVSGDTYREFYASLGEPNSVAAMPSIHLGVTLCMYLWSRSHAPRLAWWLLGYSALMGLALVYLAEHYVLDLMVGALVAVACQQLAWRLLPVKALGRPLVHARARALQSNVPGLHDHLAPADEQDPARP
jgi:membrane-associated phospholipid phosphatase